MLKSDKKAIISLLYCKPNAISDNVPCEPPTAIKHIDAAAIIVFRAKPIPDVIGILTYSFASFGSIPGKIPLY